MEASLIYDSILLLNVYKSLYHVLYAQLMSAWRRARVYVKLFLLKACTIFTYIYKHMPSSGEAVLAKAKDLLRLVSYL